MKSEKELKETTTKDVLVWILKQLKKTKPYTTSTKELLDAYYGGENYHGVNPSLIHVMLMSTARENKLLIDTSFSYGDKQNMLPYKQQYTVISKPKYRSDDEFRDICELYDALFEYLDVNDELFEKRKQKIIAEWKKECRAFTKNPNLPPKKKKAVRVKDLDRTPFDTPIPEKLPKKGINIIPIGSGSGGNAYYIEIDNHRILVDAGISVTKISNALKKNGRSIDSIDYIFITHGHADHISSIKSVSKATNCPIYTSEWTKKDLNELGVDCISIDSDTRVEVNCGLYVTMFKAYHDYVETYGFIFESEKKKVSFLTDNGYTNKKQLQYMYGSDVAILEANFDLDKLDQRGDNELAWRISVNHSSNIRCGYCMINLHESGTRNFMLGHVAKANNSNKLINDTVRTMLRSRYANVHICKQESDELLCY